jgi:hypothetical protein
MARVSVDVALGELIDKITILELKRERIHEPAKRVNVEREMALLSQALARLGPLDAALPPLTAALKEVNGRIWDLEDKVRDCERRQDFGATFVAWARAIYRANDERSVLKRRTSELLGSDIIEEKFYGAPGAQPS